MKRTPLERRTPPKAKGRSRFPKRRNPEYLAWIRTLRCLMANPWTCNPNGYVLSPGWRNSEAAHVRSRGAGGDDVGNVVPLCTGHHAEQHRIGIKSFQAKYEIDLKAEAERYAEAWRGR